MADKNYFKISVAEINVETEVGIANSVDDISQISLEYSTDDGATWRPYTVGNVITLVDYPDYPGNWPKSVVFRGDNTAFSKDYQDYHFVFTNHNITVSGNIMSLLDKSCELMSLAGKSNVFNRLFYENSHLIDASNLLLPATTLSDGCYKGMFNSCINL